MQRIYDFFSHPQRKNFLIYAFGAFFLKGVSFFLIPLFTNMLSPGELGNYELLRSFATITEIVLSLGLLQIIYAEFFEKNQKSRTRLLVSFISAYMAISTGLYLLLGGLLYFYGSLVLPGIHFYLVVLVLANTYLNFFQVLVLTVLKLTFQAVRVSVLQVTLGCTNLCINILMVYYLQSGIDGILLSSFLVTVLCCCYGIWHFRKQVFQFSFTFKWEEVRGYLAVSLPFIPNVMSFWLMNSANRWILLTYSGIDEVGMYSVAARITAVFEPLILDPFMSAYLPVVFSSFRDGKYTQGFLWRIITIPVAFVVLGFLFQSVGHLVVGTGFLDSLKLIVPLALSYAFNLIAQSSGLIMVYKKQVRQLLLCVIAGSLVSIAMNFILVPKMGAMGSAIGTIAGNAVWALVVSVYAWILIRKQLSLK